MKNTKYTILHTFLALTFNVSLIKANETVSKNQPTQEVLLLKELEESVINQSLELKSKNLETEAAKEKRSATPSNYIPKITLDGNYKYISVVPEINMAPGRTIQFGDNTNYSIGPTLSMTLFDYGSRSHLQTALNKNISSKENEYKYVQSSVLFKTRLHYLNLVLLLERRNLILDSLKVAKNQLNDIFAKKRYGAVSKLDLLTAQKEVHELEAQFKEILYNITAEQVELYKISYSQKIKNANFQTSESKIKETSSLDLESLTNLTGQFSNYQNRKMDVKSNFRVKSLQDQAESLNNQAHSIKSMNLPKVNIFARTSYDYPNGPTLAQFNQNSMGVNLTMPLFDGGELNHALNEKRLQSEAVRLQAFNEERNISESSALIIMRIENLREQNEILEKKINETSEIASLVYQSYLEGRSTFLEVERVNVKSRESKLSLSTNQYQIIYNLIQLAALTGE